jgi:hypothetical protein
MRRQPLSAVIGVTLLITLLLLLLYCCNCDVCMQVLVYHDMLGMLQHPHHSQFVPKFCKTFANVGEEVRVLYCTLIHSPSNLCYSAHVSTTSMMLYKRMATCSSPLYTACSVACVLGGLNHTSTSSKLD